MDNIVRDSSIWRHDAFYSATVRKNAYIHLGIVKEVHREKTTTELRFLVEIRFNGDPIEVNARMMTKFGGIYNYEDIVPHGYKIQDLPDLTNDFAAKAGDTVVVGFLNGESRDAIILGGMFHPGRKSIIPVDDGPQYKSEFNGIETQINKDGEWTLTFKGVPLNAPLLNIKPGPKLLPPTYDKIIGSTYMKLDKMGGWQINDNSAALPQSIVIDKTSGSLTLTSGLAKIAMDKMSNAIDVKTQDLSITAIKSISQKTVQFSVEAVASAKIKSLKVAIGMDGIELLAELAKLVDALGKVQTISPVGPCTPLAATPQWIAVEVVKAKIQQITGSF